MRRDERSALVPTADVAAFARDPVGRYTAGVGWMHFCAASDLFGVLLWGRPEAAAVSRLIISLRSELLPHVAAHVSLVDVSRVDSVDAAAFAELNSYVTDERDALSRKVTRLALVRPEGFAGAVTAGFYSVLPAPYPVEVFDDTAAALGWLGHDPELARQLVAAYAAVGGQPAEVAALARVLSAAPSATVAEAARLLGTSERTLQRRLKEVGTSYQREVARTRVREAKRRMRDSDAPLTNIALDLGFASLQAFSALFRREVGRSPSLWRADVTGAADDDS